jgi:probable F420-dependent oxidoreductase
VAAVTESIALGTSVMVLPHRHPVLAAKMLATLDHLAPGRVILGAGVGWMREEIELFGVPHGRRGAWSDEAVRIMRACWSDEHVRFRGDFFTIDDVACRPRPARGTIPIWIGGHSPRALRRVATLADGWHAAFPTPAQVAEGMSLLKEECAHAHRDPNTLTVSARMGLSARRPAAELIEETHALQALGVHHVIVEPAVKDLATMIATIERFAGEVRGAL